ncbi:diguanylate cyclase [Billgrantia gudaonensis]|uniref:Diguanylate cyclase n=1 Tax=Billgrantia gudaonensis TaxID=376427 RepID=A0A432JIL8_9GAMM|nr:diguanylate cyclase [Halomonas gudaonensis]
MGTASPAWPTAATSWSAWTTPAVRHAERKLARSAVSRPASLPADQRGQGHECGDRLLAAVAGRFTDVVAADEFIARLGGDEFAVLCRVHQPHPPRGSRGPLPAKPGAPHIPGRGAL